MSNRDTDRDVIARDDLDEGPHIGFGGIDEGEDPLRLQAHRREHPHDRRHVSLSQEEYTPEEAARLIGTTIDNVLHAIRAGELKANRAGTHVVCIKRADLVDWLNRGGGV